VAAGETAAPFALVLCTTSVLHLTTRKPAWVMDGMCHKPSVDLTCLHQDLGTSVPWGRASDADSRWNRKLADVPGISSWNTAVLAICHSEKTRDRGKGDLSTQIGPINPPFSYPASRVMWLASLPAPSGAEQTRAFSRRVKSATSQTTRLFHPFFNIHGDLVNTTLPLSLEVLRYTRASLSCLKGTNTIGTAR
jgi:hypothetical protein